MTALVMTEDRPGANTRPSPLGKATGTFALAPATADLQHLHHGKCAFGERYMAAPIRGRLFELVPVSMRGSNNAAKPRTQDVAAFV